MTNRDPRCLYDHKHRPAHLPCEVCAALAAARAETVERCAKVYPECPDYQKHADRMAREGACGLADFVRLAEGAFGDGVAKTQAAIRTLGRGGEANGPVARATAVTGADLGSCPTTTHPTEARESGGSGPTSAKETRLGHDLPGDRRHGPAMPPAAPTQERCPTCKSPRGYRSGPVCLGSDPDPWHNPPPRGGK